MDNSWQKTYDEIKDFITKNPTIEIGKDVLSIPDNVRPDFYRLFDTLRKNFIQDNFSTLLERAYALSHNHDKVRQAVTSSLNLEAIETKASLNEFVLNPINYIMRILLNPLFDLLKGKSDLTTFEQVANQNIMAAFDKFFHECYESWVTLSLLQLMAPDKAYTVPIPDQFVDQCVTDDACIHDMREVEIPDVIPIKKVSFDLTPFYPFLVPKVIVHSMRLNLFVSLIQDFHDVSQKARVYSGKLEWYKITELRKKFDRGKFWPDIAIYLAEQPNELALVADAYSLARPDIIVDIMEKKDWDKSGKLELIKYRYDVFKPRLGSFIVCLEPVSEVLLEILEPRSKPEVQLAKVMDKERMVDKLGASEGLVSTPPPATELPKEIHVISAGYNMEKLEPIIDVIIKSKPGIEADSYPE